MIQLFELTPQTFAWRAPVPRQIEQRRAAMSDMLIFDILLSAGGIKQPDALYPPRNETQLHDLLDAIEETTYDGLKKDCLIYFLLKWHKDGREVEFQEKRCIPPQFIALADAYWFLDSGEDVPVSSSQFLIRILTNVRPSAPFLFFRTHVLTATTPPKSFRRYLWRNTTRTPWSCAISALQSRSLQSPTISMLTQ